LTPRRLLSIGHSYVVGLNRRLPAELSRLPVGRPWKVTVVAPGYYRGSAGDLRASRLQPEPGEPLELRSLDAHATWSPHAMVYGRGLREILRGDWDLVHVWEEPYLLAGAQITALAPAGLPLVHFTFQNIRKRYPPPFRWTERYVLGRAAGWIAAGTTAWEVLRDRPGYRERSHAVITLGVDTRMFRLDSDMRREVRTRLGWSAPGPPVVGYLGRFVPEKGLELLTRVVDRLRSPCRVLFVGAGPLERMLRAWPSRGHDVRVVTGVAHDEVPAHLNAMDVLCAPSQTTPAWREQFGRMVVEAFACGVPVLSSDSGELPHVVGDAGRVVPESDESAWTDALQQLLESPAERERLSLAGIARARERFDWPVIARSHDVFFSRLLDDPKSDAPRGWMS
jgi:phosphatidyl-myo-inositol dimannoside synthase